MPVLKLHTYKLHLRTPKNVQNVKECGGDQSVPVPEPSRHDTHHWHPRINVSEGQQSKTSKCCDDSDQHTIHVVSESVDNEAPHRWRRCRKDVDHAVNHTTTWIRTKILASVSQSASKSEPMGFQHFLLVHPKKIFFCLKTCTIYNREIVFKCLISNLIFL